MFLFGVVWLVAVIFSMDFNTFKRLFEKYAVVSLEGFRSWVMMS